MSFLFDRLCENRGYPPDFFDEISACDHPLPLHIDQLAKRLYAYRIHQWPIIVLTDFDLDGICAGVIAYAGLCELGFSVGLFRLDTKEGYGFSSVSIDRLHEQFPGARGILTGDVGISCYGGIARAHELGLEIFVTDHHTGTLSTSADITVDPNTPEDEHAYSYICGSAVMYHLLHYYAEHYTQNKEFALQQIDRLRAFVGFATVSDSMPVYHENRGFIQDAVYMCQFLYASKDLSVVNMIPGTDVYRRIFFGLFEVLSAFDNLNKFQSIWSIDEDFFGYYLAPMFNSIKRMEEDVGIAYSIFFGGSQAAQDGVEYLLDLNERRKELVKVFFVELQKQLNDPGHIPYIYTTDAPGGICGLLAQQILSVTGMPALVVRRSDDGGCYTGSGRSPEWYPYLDMAGYDHLERWSAAGHNPAFGIYIKDHKSMRQLSRFLSASIPAFQPQDSDLEFKPDFVIDTSGQGDVGIDIHEFQAFLRDVKLCRPFGNGLLAHQALLKFKTSEAAWILMGSEKQHVKLILPGGLQVLCFNQGMDFHGEILLEYLPEEIEIIGSLSYNEFNSMVSVQFMGDFVGDIFQDHPKPESEFSDSIVMTAC